MKLQNELYKIIHFAQNSEKLCVDLQLNATHVIYSVHFPNEPITPGVCIIQIAKELLEIYLKRDLTITEVKNVKFLSVISPVETPLVTYSFEKISATNEEGEVKSQIIVGNAEKQFAKISLTCK